MANKNSDRNLLVPSSSSFSLWLITFSSLCSVFAEKVCHVIEMLEVCKPKVLERKTYLRSTFLALKPLLLDMNVVI